MSQQWSLKKILPFDSHFQSVAGYRMHYIDEGSGPVVLLLHGNPTWSFYYRKLIAALRDHYRVIAPDYIGCGLSDHPAQKHFRALDRISQVEEFIEKLGLSRFSLVMHDWGGPIGTAVAGRRPERIERIVYLNTTLTETESLPLLIKKAANPLIGKFLTKYTKRFIKFMLSFGICHRLPKEIEAGYYYPYLTRSQRTAIWDFVADIPFNNDHPSYLDMLEMAESIKKLQHVPVRIIWGLKDPCFHRHMLGKVAKHFPAARILEIPDASHLVLEDAPELVTKTIRGFLSGEESTQETPREFKQNALYEAFVGVCKTRAKDDAVIVPSFQLGEVKYAHTSFEDLHQLVNKYQRGLSELGLRSGDKVIMLVPPGREFVALSYAVAGRGAIPVFLDPGMGKDNLVRCINEIQPQAFIGSLKAQILRLIMRKSMRHLKFHLTVSPFPIGSKHVSFLEKFSAQPLSEAVAPEVALIAYTSGATGAPKGVLFTNEMIREQLRIFSEEFGLEAGKKDLPLLPIFSLFTVALGVCSVFPPIDVANPISLDTVKTLRLMHDFGINYSFGSPTLWNKIAEYCTRVSENLPSIEKVFMAGAPVSSEILQRVKSIAPNGEAFTPYGSTEALPVSIISSKAIQAFGEVTAHGGEIGTPLGKVVKGVTLRVIENVEGEIKDGSEMRDVTPFTIGEIVVNGQNVSRSYFERPAATHLAKVKDNTTVWHRMGDMGYLDGEGNLFFCGRKAHIVRCNGRTYFSVPTERIFNAHPKVRRSALVSLFGGKEVGIVVEPHPRYFPESEAERMAFAAELLELGRGASIAQGIHKFFFHPSFPVDARHNAKIFREQLGVWASELNPYQSAA